MARRNGSILSSSVMLPLVPALNTFCLILLRALLYLPLSVLFTHGIRCTGKAVKIVGVLPHSYVVIS